MSTPISMSKQLAAEFFGTFWLVFGGCGSAVFAAKFFATQDATPINIGIGLVGVSFAFGLTVLTMAYAIGHISGCHLNPAVSIGLCVGGRFPGAKLPGYIGAQVLGGIAAAGALYVILKGQAGFTSVGGFAANGYDELSPGKYNMISCLIAEALLTMFFLLVILGSTDDRAPKGLAPIAIGLCLTLIHLISIPITNTSVNPARSTSQAIFAGGGYIGQVWLFWVAPIVGAAIGGVIYKALWAESKA